MMKEKYITQNHNFIKTIGTYQNGWDTFLLIMQIRSVKNYLTKYFFNVSIIKNIIFIHRFRCLITITASTVGIPSKK